MGLYSSLSYSLQASHRCRVNPTMEQISIMLLVHCPICGAEGDETDFMAAAGPFPAAGDA